MTTSLADPAVSETLDRLHEAARGEWRRGLGLVPKFVLSRVTGRSFMKMVPPDRLSGLALPVSRAGGQLLYAVARGLHAQRIVEFGASFGISTLYLAAAARDTGGRLITTEIVPAKCRIAEENLRRAGLAEVVEVREGDALATLAGLADPVDLLFLDGWKDLYLPVLDLLAPRLRPGSVVLADNINFPEVKPYLEYVRTDPRFASAQLPGSHLEATWVVYS